MDVNNLINEVFEEEITVLNHNVRLYIPTIGKDGSKLGTLVISHKLEFYSDKMNELFGGATVSEAYGLWTDSDNKPHKENVYVISSNAYELNFNNLNAVRNYASIIRDTMNQEAVTIEIDGKMLFI